MAARHHKCCSLTSKKRWIFQHTACMSLSKGSSGSSSVLREQGRKQARWFTRTDLHLRHDGRECEAIRKAREPLVTLSVIGRGPRLERGHPVGFEGFHWGGNGRELGGQQLAGQRR
jgi:hypothetical protein